MRARAAWTCLAGLGLAAPAAAEPLTDGQIIEAAGIEIAQIQKQGDHFDAAEAATACYAADLAKARSFDAVVKRCLALDIINAKVAAPVYGAMTAQQRAAVGAPEPKAVIDGMIARTVSVLSRLKVPQDEARVFYSQAQTIGIPAYVEARYGKDALKQLNTGAASPPAR